MSGIRSLFIGIVVAFLLSVITCMNNPITDAQSVALEKDALVIIYMLGDSANSVTSNIGLLISGSNGTSISWASSNNSLISINGYVNRPDSGRGDSLVTMTATISKGSTQDNKVFNLTVKENKLIIGSVSDIDGNFYKVIRIGNQMWTVENLRTTKYNDGTSIPYVPDCPAWNGLMSPAYCYYNNTTNMDSIKKFGALYNWYAVDTKKLAPLGWHVPTKTEWDTLQNYLISKGYNWDGTTTGNKIAKSLASTTDWYVSSTAGDVGNNLTLNNKTGFSALPGGSRSSSHSSIPPYTYDCSFNYIGSCIWWWSATEVDGNNAFRTGVCYCMNDLDTSFNYKGSGMYVRIVGN